MLVRMHNKPEGSADSILGEYYNAFGKAKGAVKEYFKHWEDVTSKISPEKMVDLIKKTGGQYSTWYVFSPYIFTDKVMERGRLILEKAKQAAKDESHVVKTRVAFLYNGFKNALLTLEVEKKRKIYEQQRSAAKEKEYHQAIKKLYDFRYRVETTGIANMSFLKACEGRKWDVAILAQKTGSRKLTEKWNFKWDSQDTGISKGFYKKNYDSSKWPKINTGAWEKQAIGQEWKQEHGDDYNGIAWYRTSFMIPKSAKGKRIILMFGSVDESCIVWLNGKKALERKYDKKLNPNSWQEPFEVDITDMVSYGSENILAVRVEDKAGAGGITRDVYIHEQAAIQGENLVKNGNFSTGKLSPWKISFPKGKPSGAETKIIKTTKQNYLFINLPENVYARINQSNIPLKKGKKYQFLMKYKTSADFNGKIKISLADGNKVTPKVKGFGTNNNWLFLSKEFIAASPKLYLLISMTAQGKIFIDSVSVSQVGETK